MSQKNEKLTIPESLESVKIVETIAAGTDIIGPDEVPDFLYKIDSGFTRFYLVMPNGKKIVYSFYGPGDVFFVSHIFHRQPLGAFLQATEETVISKYPITAIRDELGKNSELTINMLDLVIGQSLLLRSQLDNVSLNFVSERIAFRLLVLADRFGVKTREGVVLPLITQQDIANTISLSREVVSKGLKRLERNGVISRQGRRLCVVDVPKLLSELSRVKVPPRLTGILKKFK